MEVDIFNTLSGVKSEGSDCFKDHIAKMVSQGADFFKK